MENGYNYNRDYNQHMTMADRCVAAVYSWSKSGQQATLIIVEAFLVNQADNCVGTGAKKELERLAVVLRRAVQIA